MAEQKLKRDEQTLALAEELRPFIDKHGLYVFHDAAKIARMLSSAREREEDEQAEEERAARVEKTMQREEEFRKLKNPSYAARQAELQAFQEAP